MDAATPGGQTNAQSISLDAIEQISVSVAPYDVTQSGFTGASVDAVLQKVVQISFVELCMDFIEMKT